MRNAMWCAVALALFGVQPARAEPISPATRHNVRCLLVATHLANDDDASKAEVGKRLTYYFDGLIAGSDPHIDLPALAWEEAKHMSPSDFDKLPAPCTAEVEAHSADIEAVSEDALTAVTAQ